jgi:hypothetical protein
MFRKTIKSVMGGLIKRNAITQKTETSRKYKNTFVAILVIFFKRGCFVLLLALVVRVFAMAQR